MGAGRRRGGAVYGAHLGVGRERGCTGRGGDGLRLERRRSSGVLGEERARQHLVVSWMLSRKIIWGYVPNPCPRQSSS